MQRGCEIEGGSSSGLVAHERCIEARSQGMGLPGLMQLCKADWLITEGRQNFLMPQQAPAVRFKHQHRFANTATGYAGRTSNGYRLIGRNGWEPDVETRSSSKSALYLHGSVVLPDEFTNRREPETVAVRTCGKEWLENPLQRCFVYARSGIRNRNDH